MNAREIVAKLGGRWYGSYGLAQCPAHDDGETPALSITQGDDGRLLAHCHAGCPQAAVIARLGTQGLWSGCDDGVEQDPAERECSRRKREAEETKRRESALRLWHEACPGGVTLVRSYLRSRGVTLEPPKTLRYLADARHGPTGLVFPAMVAAIAGLDRRITAVHRTFLLPDGSGKASVSAPKLAFGPIGTGSVHLAPAGPALAVGEGIETCLSFQQLTGIPTWAACGSWLERVAVPATVARVVIAADRGAAGEQAAERAAKAHHDAGRVVDVRFPAIGKDFNDQLQATGKAA